MVLAWLVRRRRKKLLARPFPADWAALLRRNVLHYSGLDSAEQAKLRNDLRIILAEKNWEGCGSLQMTDEVKVTIAGQAALLTLGFDGEYFETVKSILVYPDAYVAAGHTITKSGVVLEEDSVREGEAWYRGPVVLSWSDALAGGRCESSGDNLVLHEFAHQLDMQNGREVDGTPLLSTRQQYDRWQEVIQREYQLLIRACDHGNATLLDCYGATNLGEFFAVCTECFFQRPREMAGQHAELYGILREYYRQDPAARGPR